MRGVYGIIYEGSVIYVYQAQIMTRRFAQHHAKMSTHVKSPEHREKLRQAKLGKLNEIVSQAMGRKQSPETVAKRVASLKKTIEKRREAAL